MSIEIIAFESPGYWAMIKRIEDMFVERLRQEKIAATAADEWVTKDEAIKLLGYRSKRKWQQLRNSRAVLFTKYGNIIKYNKKSLLAYIEKHKKI